MKNLNKGKTLLNLAGVVLVSSAIVLPALTDRAAADPAVVQEAQQLCVEDAKAKGFDLKEVVTAGPADRPGEDAKIVLHLLKGGQDYKQTCYYDKNAKSVSFSDDAATAGTTAPEKTYTPALWWLLLPILGLPLLLWATRNRHVEGARTVADGAKAYATRYYDALIRTTDGNPINVYEDPSYTSRVLGTVQDGQSVRVTGRENDDWFELVGGGWLPKQYVRTSMRT